MNDKTIQERCIFQTERLSVYSFIERTKDLDSEKNFEKKAIEILTPNVTKSLPDGWQNIRTTNAVKKWINERDSESHFLSIQFLPTNETIGFIFLYESDSKQNYYNLRFGYLLSEKYWGKGLGTELIKGLLKWCKDAKNIHSISGGVETSNIGSIKVLEKTGFTASKLEDSTEEVVFYEYHFN